MCIKHPHRDTYLSRHHILAKIRNGSTNPKNLINLWRDRHSAWHRLYQNRTVEEIINCFHIFAPKEHTDDWLLLWGYKSPTKIIAILKRTMRIKRQLKRKKACK